MLGVIFWFTGHPIPESNALPETPNTYHFVTRTKANHFSVGSQRADSGHLFLVAWVLGSNSTLDL